MFPYASKIHIYVYIYIRFKNSKFKSIYVYELKTTIDNTEYPQKEQF